MNEFIIVELVEGYDLTTHLFMLREEVDKFLKETEWKCIVVSGNGHLKVEDHT